MVYPSHWGAGEYGVADPIRQRGDIVDRSLADFYAVAVAAGSDAAIVPWLQAFSAKGVEDGQAAVDQVRAQIDAAMGVGSSGFLLWNANSAYDPAALTETPWASRRGLATPDGHQAGHLIDGGRCGE